MINTILFDLDGTLLNTLKDLNEAVNYSITKFGYEKSSLDDTRRNIGNGIKNLVLRSMNHDETHLDEAFKLFKEYYSSNLNIYTKPYNNIIEVLDTLKLKGYKLGVITNKAYTMAKELLDSHFPNTFDIILGDLMGLDRKPNPSIFLYACDKLNINKDNAIYIGDSDVDIDFINNIGCKGIVVSYGYRDKSDLLKKTNKVYDNPLDIIKVVEEFNKN